MSRNPDEPAFRRTGHNGQPRGRQAGATAGHMITTTTTSRSHRRARDAAGNHQKLDVSKHSSKKITKTQQASGRLSAQRRLVGRAVILGLVALGAGFVTFSATGHDGDANFGGPLIGDDIHAADGVLACDTFGAPFVAVAVAVASVNNGGGGILLLHPFSTLDTGDDASLAACAETTGIIVGDESCPAGTTYVNGGDWSGTDGKVQLRV